MPSEAEGHALQAQRRPRLWLEVSRAGGRHWRYRYKLGGKEHLYAAGKWCVAPYGETDMQTTARRAAGMLTLSEARAEREMWRAMVVRGSHPIDAKRAEKLTAAASNANTFAAVSAEFVRTRGQEWSESHRFRVESFMQRDVFPEIGALPVRDVTSAMVLAILRKVEARQRAKHGRSGPRLYRPSIPLTLWQPARPTMIPPWHSGAPSRHATSNITRRLRKRTFQISLSAGHQSPREPANRDSRAAAAYLFTSPG